MDVRLVLDRAAERDRQRKGGEQGRERAWPRSQPQISNRKSAKVIGVDEKTIRNDRAENSAPWD